MQNCRMTKFIPTNVFYIINIIKLDSKEYSFIRKNNNYLPVLSVVLEQRRVIPELTVGKITITLIAYLPWAGLVLSTLHRLAYNPHHSLLRRFCEEEETEAREAHLPISGGAPLSLNHSAVGWSPQVPSRERYVLTWAGKAVEGVLNISQRKPTVACSSFHVLPHSKPTITLLGGS